MLKSLLAGYAAQPGRYDELLASPHAPRPHWDAFLRALAARGAGRELLWGPVGFAAMLLAGAVLGLQGVAVPAVEPMIAASLLVTGLLVVSRLRVPGVVAALVVPSRTRRRPHVGQAFLG